MPKAVECNILLNAAHFCHIFKILIHLLIAENWKDISFLALPAITLNQLHRYVKNRHVHGSVGFVTVGHNPLIAVNDVRMLSSRSSFKSMYANPVKHANKNTSRTCAMRFEVIGVSLRTLSSSSVR